MVLNFLVLYNLIGNQFMKPSKRPEIFVCSPSELFLLHPTLHSKLYSMQCTVCTVYSIYTVHGTQYTVQCRLQAVLCTQGNVHSNHCNLHCTLSMFFFVYCTLLIAINSILLLVLLLCYQHFRLSLSHRRPHRRKGNRKCLILQKHFTF